MSVCHVCLIHSHSSISLMGRDKKEEQNNKALALISRMISWAYNYMKASR